MVKKSAAKHLQYFLDNFSQKTDHGYIIFTGDNPARITDKITAVPYSDLVNRVLKPFTQR
jgi:hypothetical protein